MVENVKAHGGYAKRIEDQYAVGTLDLIFIVKGITVFAEAKRYKGNSFEPTPRQYVEMTRIEYAGGNAVLVGCEPGLVSITRKTEKAFRTDPGVKHYDLSKNDRFYEILLDYMRNHYNVR